jgi:diguanylate cyclase (GGDEF)-like protein
VISLKNIVFFLTGNYLSEDIEILVAVIIILVTSVVLFFLYRNVVSELRKFKEERIAFKKDKEAASGNKDEESVEHLFEKKDRAPKKFTGDIFQQLDQTLQYEKEGMVSALFYLNLDNFKSSVEKMGGDVANKAIKEIAQRLKKVGEKKHLSGNWKEDIFLYYYPGPIDNELIKQMANQLMTAVSAPLKSTTELLTTSMGIALFPYDGINASQLVKNAEVALYVAKKQGKNQFALYSAELLESEQFNVTYYQEIKRSIQNEEFILYYQPMVDVKTGKIIAFESLLRWNHPTLGVLPPSKFLNVMDLTGDITWFGSWGFERVVKQYVQWKKLFRIRDLFISINLSPKQLMMDGLARTFFDIVRKNEFDTESFCLEIIDYYTVVRNPIALHNMNEFRRYGFRVAMDDLGDQYELLTDMDRVIANIIKINREDILKIVNGSEGSDKVLRTIGLATQKQKVVIAEGIEDERMVQMLSTHGVRFMQGYYFSPPKSTDEAQAMLKTPPWGMHSFSKLTK